MAKKAPKRLTKTMKREIVIPRPTKQGCELKVVFVIPRAKGGCDA
jgi:hypothetical protein